MLQNSAKIKPRQHIFAVPLVTSPGIIRSECKSTIMSTSFTRAPDKRYCSQKSFLFLHENIYYGYSLKAPCWGASNKYPQHVLAEKQENIETLISIFQLRKGPYMELCLLSLVPNEFGDVIFFDREKKCLVWNNYTCILTLSPNCKNR